ncbi:hypothetical protein NC651_016519 [Populus alba x Populus x berolinensis]|nr:hypothetical protein NC651_016519 [Populus alba x Populus x berolinensis]
MNGNDSRQTAHQPHCHTTQEEAAVSYGMALIIQLILTLIKNLDQHSFTTNKPGQPSETILIPLRPAAANPTSALGLLLQSSKFKEMMEMTAVTDCPPTSFFPKDVQTYFECQYSSSYGDQGDDMIFGDYNLFMPPMFHFDF